MSRRSSSLRLRLDTASVDVVLEQPGPRSLGVALLVQDGGPSSNPERTARLTEDLRARGLATAVVELRAHAERDGDEGGLATPAAAARLVRILDELAAQGLATERPLVLVGVDTAAAAVLVAASERPRRVAAVIACGGVLDTAAPALAALRTPTLFLLGSRDLAALRLHAEALRVLVTRHRLVVVPGASHLFEEPGALEEAAEAAAGWLEILARRAAAVSPNVAHA